MPPTQRSKKTVEPVEGHGGDGDAQKVTLDAQAPEASHDYRDDIKAENEHHAKHPTTPRASAAQTVAGTTAATLPPGVTVGSTSAVRTAADIEAERRSVVPVDPFAPDKTRLVAGVEPDADDMALEGNFEDTGDRLVRVKEDVYEEYDLPGVDYTRKPTTDAYGNPDPIRKGRRLLFPKGRVVALSKLQPYLDAQKGS